MIHRHEDWQVIIICMKDLANSLNHHERRNQIFKYFVSINTGEKSIRSPLSTFYTTSVCIFSVLFSIHFLRCRLGEFAQQSRASLVGDRFLYSHDLNARFGVEIVGRN